MLIGHEGAQALVCKAKKKAPPPSQARRQWRGRRSRRGRSRVMIGVRVYVGLGANFGNRERRCCKPLQSMAALPQTQLLAVYIALQQRACGCDRA